MEPAVLPELQLISSPLAGWEEMVALEGGYGITFPTTQPPNLPQTLSSLIIKPKSLGLFQAGMTASK